MSDLNDFIIQLKAVIDQSSLAEEQKKLLKNSLKIKVEVDKEASQQAIDSLANSMLTFQKNNTKMTRAMKQELDSMYKNLINGANLSEKEVKELRHQFNQLKLDVREAGRLGKSFGDSVKQGMESFSTWLPASQLIMAGVNKTHEAITELIELDDILTEISKTSDLTKRELQELGDAAFESASDLGRNASDYLTAVQEMSRSGFVGEQAESMAEQSLLAQTAGDLNAELANTYVLATNAAYKLNGEATKLNAVLDGQNSITNRNSVAMEDMALAMSEAGTVASSYRVSVEDLSAMIGTIESVTKLGGSEVGNGIKSILINLQNISSSKITGTLDKAGASMTELVNGTEQLRDPIAILRDLSATFNSLEETDPLRAEILTNIGGKYQATKLAALLQNMELFDKMLIDYSEGSGSALKEAEKSANNITGSLNKLSNTWTDIVENVLNSDVILGTVNGFNGLLTVINEITSALGTWGTLGVGVGAFAIFKNVDYLKMPVCPHHI